MARRRNRNRSRIAGLLAAVAAVGVAIGVVVASTGGGTSSPNATPTVSVAPSHGVVRAGDAAPSFSGTATDGSHVDLAALHGRVVLLSFFASWCTNCREDLPRVQAAGAAYASRGLSVLPISYLETGDSASFLRSIGVTVPSLIDASNRIGEAYGITGLPVTVWVGKDARVPSVLQGQLTQEALDAELAQLLR